MSLATRLSRGVRLLLLGAAAAVFVLGYLWGNQSQRRQAQAPAIGGLLIRPPLAAPDFRLQEPTGLVFDRTALAAGWTLVAFADLGQASGQTAVRRLVEVYNRVSDREALYRDLRLALVLTGEAPDQARALARLSPALHVLAGERAGIARLAEGLGQVPGEAGTLFVFAPGGRLVALLDAAEGPARQASDLAALYEHADLLLSENP